MEIQTYNEFKVVFDNKGSIIDKKQTARGAVRINANTAKVNNSYSKSTGLVYELDKPKPGRKPKQE